MQIGSFETIGKYVLAIAVIGILVYIVVRVRRINVGNWTIDGSSDDVLKFVSPAKDVIFTVNQDNQGITVKNYLIKGDDNGLQFFNPKFKQMARMREKELYIGDLGTVNKVDEPLSDSSGVLFVDMSKGETIAVLNSHILRWPKNNLLIKSEELDGNPSFQAYDQKNNKVILQAPTSAQYIKSVPTYNII